MGIRINYEAAGIPVGEPRMSKYGQSLALQQRQFDNQDRQMQQDAMYDMQRLGARQSAAPVSKLPNKTILDDINDGIMNGEFDDVTARKLKANMAHLSEIMTDPGIDAVQRDQATKAINSRINSMMALRRASPVAAMGAQQAMMASAGGGGGMTGPAPAELAFQANQKVEDRFVALAEKDAEAKGEVLSYGQLLEKAKDIYNERQSFFQRGLNPQQANAAATQQPAAPSNDGPMGPPSPPKPGSRGYIPAQPMVAGQGQLSSSQGMQSSGKRGYMFIKPSGNSVTQLGGGYAPPQPAPAASPSDRIPGSGQYTMDTIYDAANPQQSPGINFFDPNNPAYAAMRGPDPAYMNPAPRHSMQTLPGGGVDFGQGPSGQNVSTRVRPGGTMAEYNPAVGVKAPVTDQWFKDRGIQQVQASPGEKPDSAQAARDEVANLKAVVNNPKVTREDKIKAAEKLLRMGIGPDSVSSGVKDQAARTGGSPMPTGAFRGRGKGYVEPDTSGMKRGYRGGYVDPNYDPNAKKEEPKPSPGRPASSVTRGYPDPNYQPSDSSLLGQLKQAEQQSQKPKESNLSNSDQSGVMNLKDNPTYKDIADAYSLLGRTDIPEESKKKIQEWIDFHYKRMQSKPAKKGKKMNVGDSPLTTDEFPNIDWRGLPENAYNLG